MKAQKDNSETPRYPNLVCPRCLHDASNAKEHPAYHNREDYECLYCGYLGDSVEFQTIYKRHPIHNIKN